MAKGKQQQRQASLQWAGKGKGMGTYNPIRAAPMAETYHNAVLRSYPGEDGSVFVRRGGAGKDADLLTLTGMAERLNRSNHEGCNRPGVWLSTLAASLSQGLRVINFALDAPDKNGTAFIAANAPPRAPRGVRRPRPVAAPPRR